MKEGPSRSFLGKCLPGLRGHIHNLPEIGKPHPIKITIEKGGGIAVQTKSGLVFGIRVARIHSDQFAKTWIFAPKNRQISYSSSFKSEPTSDTDIGNTWVIFNKDDRRHVRISGVKLFCQNLGDNGITLEISSKSPIQEIMTVAQDKDIKLALESLSYHPNNSNKIAS